MLRELGFIKTAASSQVIRQALTEAKSMGINIHRSRLGAVDSVLQKANVGPKTKKLIRKPLSLVVPAEGGYVPKVKEIYVPRKSKLGLTPTSTFLHEFGHAIDDGNKNLNLGGNKLRTSLFKELSADKNVMDFIKKTEKPELVEASLSSYKHQSKIGINSYKKDIIKAIHSEGKSIFNPKKYKKPSMSETKAIIKNNKFLTQNI